VARGQKTRSELVLHKLAEWLGDRRLDRS
jgi:hypothetical protein